MIRLELSDSDLSALNHAMVLAQERLINFAQLVNSQISIQQGKPPSGPNGDTPAPPVPPDLKVVQ